MSGTKIPATIVTGFLGAGKTTLIRHVLENAKDRHLALVINEFGDVGVDGEILRACGVENCLEENIVELANGCLCCTVADDFIPAIEALLAHEKRPDHIIIETSGLALPKPLIKAFDWPAIRSKLTVDGVIAVIDGKAVAEGRFADNLNAIAQEREDTRTIDHDNPLEEVFDDQLACADLIILNKTDLLGADEERDVADRLALGARKAAKIVRASGGRVDPLVLLGLSAAAEDDLATRPSHHDAEPGHDHDDFDSFVVSLSAVADPAALVARLAEAARAHDVLRIKGFVEVVGKPMRLLVQGVGARIEHHFDRAWKPDEPRMSRVVIIGEKGLNRDAVIATLAQP
ncbi:cobalamin biosynthesis protein CobW [Methylocystis sp. H4A]|uniref:cobalamin biosynthesis protein CobW n=1 Tax=Methylocystis sp. H4A TaxID=2785788 RepID=UPI0018C28DD2|nr:cobalamin biosynthesis protein CobW [Methylocystis sp. H4A]MBG0803360.1 cobalamin biosynthesis protein CobW [Methylocystis sp. H4A]